MRLSVLLAPDIAVDMPLAEVTCVVIDVLRATTSMTAALDASAKAIYPLPDAAAAWELQSSLGGEVLLGGERQGIKINGFDLGNSPREYLPRVVGGRLLAMTTSNGTAALLAASAGGAAPIYVGSLRNAPAVARRLLREGRPTLLYCAGTRGMVSLDDVIAAGAIVSACAEAPAEVELSDTARLAQAAYHAVRKDLVGGLRASAAGRWLIDIGYGADIEYAAEIGTCSVIGQFDGVMIRPAGHVLRRVE